LNIELYLNSGLIAFKIVLTKINNMFTGTEDNEISYNDAALLTQNYRDAQVPGSNYVKGEYFSKASLESVLDQSGCVGIRIYYGLDENNVQRLVIVGADANENDIVTGIILEHGTLCPPHCGTGNNLNS
jgi:hypothetical protein